jgi:hypothetical protein
VTKIDVATGFLTSDQRLFSHSIFQSLSIHDVKMTISPTESVQVLVVDKSSSVQYRVYLMNYVLSDPVPYFRSYDPFP